MHSCAPALHQRLLGSSTLALNLQKEPGASSLAWYPSQLGVPACTLPHPMLAAPRRPALQLPRSNDAASPGVLSCPGCSAGGHALPMHGGHCMEAIGSPPGTQLHLSHINSTSAAGSSGSHIEHCVLITQRLELVLAGTHKLIHLGAALPHLQSCLMWGGARE